MEFSAGSAWIEITLFSLIDDFSGDHLGLLQHCFCGQQLHIRRITILPQDALHDDFEFGPDTFFDRPVDRGILADFLGS
jgi:hypothetical protein